MRQPTELLLLLLLMLVTCLVASGEASSGGTTPGRQRAPARSSGAPRRAQPAAVQPQPQASSTEADTLDADLPSPDSLPEPSLSGNSPTTADESAGGPESQAEKPRVTGAVRLSNSSLVLLWELDADVEQLQYFVIQYRNKKSNRWITLDQNPLASSRAYQIGGLKPGEYLFIVNAVYVHGNSHESNEFKFRLRANSKIKPEDLPNQQAPVIDRQEVSHDQIRFHWSYAYREVDFDYIGYLVYYRSTHSMKDFLIYNTQESDVELVDLESDTPYEMKVVAYNNISVSQFSQPVIIRTALLNDTNTTQPPEDSDSSSSNATATATSSPITTSTGSAGAGSTSTPPPPPPSGARTTLAADLPGKPLTETPTKTPELATTPPLKTAPDQHQQPAKPTSVHHPEQPSGNELDLSPLVELLGSPVGGRSSPLRYYHLAIVFLVILVFIALAISLANCRAKLAKSPPSSTNESMTFDIEINGYFKNSFPGVDDTDYHHHHPVSTPNEHLDGDHNHHHHHHHHRNNHHPHEGFINNHPHINDFP